MKRRQKKRLPFFFVTHVNNILHSFSSNVEVYINNQQICNSSGLYAHTFYISINFKGAISEHKVVLHCEGYYYEELLDEIIEAPLSELFSQEEWKCLADLIASCCMVNWGLIFLHFWIVVSKYEN